MLRSDQLLHLRSETPYSNDVTGAGLGRWCLGTSKLSDTFDLADAESNLPRIDSIID